MLRQAECNCRLENIPASRGFCGSILDVGIFFGDRDEYMEYSKSTVFRGNACYDNLFAAERV